ncbi:DUF2314 domain-containing protein [Hymenobacter busanensis]|uniref:DUF2314 domain-containing protein n=1 Tax=Hymenobacter busanensis TaxID=2607656 RepID=A0A7L4ZW09_9BACT|nr:DUF2314 domain-containing protein [Hymenobacter busanensis]KAA9325337.1 DUF2314 domain-containing protein [Hymenobacter busanensis]QHJ07669.1 DUF2314 domain-containing protein [Hymenobacter busanensis]
MNKLPLLRQLLKNQYLIFGAAASFFFSCEHSGNQSGYGKNSDMYDVSVDDPGMVTAMQHSRNAVDEFVSALVSKDTTLAYFSIKAAFTGGSMKEHIWIKALSVKGDTIYGEIDNEPEHTKEVMLGQRIAVLKDSVSDWMYTRNGKLVGGFTIREYRKRLTQDARIEFDQSTHMKFE